jgi:hypothetical protein
MTSRVYSTWNPNACYTGLVLDQGNLQVTTGSDALSNSRKVLGTLPKSGSVGQFETVFYSVPRVNLGTNVAVGLAQPGSPLGSAVGADSSSWGYYPATGDVVNNGSTLTTLTVVDERQTITIYMEFFGGNLYMNIAVNGTALYQVQIDPGFYVPALTLAGGNAGETIAQSNFGQRGFDYPRIIAVPV